jgi:enoyl-[acyl-carrier-protein] reductase (NADH)
MALEVPRPALKGAKALVVGIANEHSIAYGCARAFRELGEDLAITYLNEKSKSYVEPLAKTLEAPIFLPLDELVDVMDVGFTCAYLATPYARRLSGETLYVDGGVNIMA